MTLPRIFGAGRRKIFLLLALIGLSQAVAVIAMSMLLSRGLAGGATPGALPVSAVAGLVSAGVVVLILRAFERAQAERLGQLYIIACRSRLFKALNDLPLRGGPKVRYGIMMTRMITDLTSMKNWIAWGVAKLVVAAFSISGAIIALYMLSPELTVEAGLVLATLLAIGLAASVIYRRKVRRARRLRGRLAASVGELAPARGLPVHFGRLDLERTRLKAQSREMTDALVERSFVSGFMRSLSDLVLPMTLAAAALGTNFAVGDAQLPIGTLAVGLFLIALASAPLRDVMLALEFRANFKIGREKLLAAFAEFSTPPEPRKCPLKGRRGPAALTLTDATVPGIRDNVSATLKPGQMVLLGGPGGSGKSSLLCAIARLTELDEPGSDAGIAIDGCDLVQTSARNWHRRVKLISGDMPLLKGSLSRNVRYGNRRLDEADVLKVLDLCGIDPAHGPLSDGLKSRLEEGARNLPSGLRSRICLARAIASDPGLILIDDPNFLIDPDCMKALRNVSERGDVSIIMTTPGTPGVLEWDQVWRLHDRGMTVCTGVNGENGKANPITLTAV